MSQKMLVRDDPLVFHFRVRSGDTCSPKGGVTIVFSPIHDKRSGRTGQFGIALCSPKDRYVKHLGYTIAERRSQIDPLVVGLCESVESPAEEIRSGRCNKLVSYYGPLTLDAVRERASVIAQEAASLVGNPINES